MIEKKNDTITVIVEDEQKSANRTDKRYLGTPRGSSDKATLRPKSFPVSKIGDSVALLSAQLNAVFNDIKQVGGFQLKEVQVQAEISSEGGVNLIGTAKAGLKGAVTLTFKSD